MVTAAAVITVGSITMLFWETTRVEDGVDGVENCSDGDEDDDDDDDDCAEEEVGGDWEFV
jgi:hypothetical protein